MKIKKETYKAFKQSVLDTMDEDYIKITEERFKRGDFNQEIDFVEEPEEISEEPPRVRIG